MIAIASFGFLQKLSQQPQTFSIIIDWIGIPRRSKTFQDSCSSKKYVTIVRLKT